MKNASKFFTVLVVGKNPEELLKKYDLNLQVERYCKYHYLDAEKIRKNSIKSLQEIVNNADKFKFTEFQLEFLKERIKALQNTSNFDYYTSLTKGMYYDENGDAWTTENPNGKWLEYKIGKDFSLPFQLKDGTTTNQAIKKDVAWDKMHMANTTLYSRVWELIKEGKTPENEQDETIINNMKDKVNYFNSFATKNEYIIHNCAYWNYAFLDENGWIDLDSDGNQTEWISHYYERFINTLDEDAVLTIFECRKQKEE